MTGSTSSSLLPGPLPAAGDLMLRLTGEITTKGRRTRSRFQKKLVENIRDSMESSGADCRLRAEWSRLYLRTDADASEALARVYGVSTFSLLEAECEAALPTIVETGRRTFGDRVRGRSFAVRARRAGSHDFNSQDVMRELGAALGENARVDLGQPDIEVFVEVRDEHALFYADRTRGAGGLPLGVEGRAVCLLSGGFDSAVAAWMMLRRGVALDYVFCNLGGDAYQRMVLEVASVLADEWSYGTRPTLLSLDFEPVVEELRRTFRPAFQQIALKREMYRAAAAAGQRLGADAIVTGEAVGQVSSQTLANLRAIDDASSLPVLRPLVGMDKEEIISRSRHIGTYQLSAKVREYCSISTGRPATAASPQAVLQEETGLDASVLAASLDTARLFDLRGIDMAVVAGESVFVDAVPEGATVLDARAPEAYRAWHWSGAEHMEYTDLMAEYETLRRDTTYVLYCEFGLKSARVAERMQKAGYEAYSFLGGVKALRSRAARVENGERGSVLRKAGAGDE
jgi:thiamine biosynthesis protein ThiI